MHRRPPPIKCISWKQCWQSDWEAAQGGPHGATYFVSLRQRSNYYTGERQVTNEYTHTDDELSHVCVVNLFSEQMYWHATLFLFFNSATYSGPPSIPWTKRRPGLKMNNIISKFPFAGWFMQEADIFTYDAEVNGKGRIPSHRMAVWAPGSMRSVTVERQEN